MLQVQTVHWIIERSFTFGPVEHFELDPRGVASPRAKAVKSVHLLDEVAFADPTKAGVARHLADSLKLLGHQQSLAPHPVIRAAEKKS